MKIQRDTDDQLIIENRPLLLAVLVSALSLVFVAIGLFVVTEDFLFGLMFTVGGLFFLVVFNLAFVRRTQVILDRPRNLVEMQRKSFLGYKSRTWDLHDLDRVVVESSRSDGTNTYRATMVFTGGMDAGSHPITLVYSSGRGADLAADAINNWLARGPHQTDSDA